MTRRPRRNHSPAFKAKVALAAIRGEQKTLVELSQPLDVHANQIKQWKDQLLEGATGVFGDEWDPEPKIDPVEISDNSLKTLKILKKQRGQDLRRS